MSNLDKMDMFKLETLDAIVRQIVLIDVEQDANTEMSELIAYTVKDTCFRIAARLGFSYDEVIGAVERYDMEKIFSCE